MALSNSSSITMNLVRERHKYIESAHATILNTVDVWRPAGREGAASSGGIWIVYIHGGAWRDPAIDSLSFNPTLDAFSESTLANMDGVASINYRLSAYPDHSTNPSADDDPSRNAKHPDHVEDVTTTLLFLQRQYGIDGRYVLVGHSCGATLALQVPATFERQVVPRPAAIIGSEGIYDIPNLVKVHTHPAYRQFVVSAFGDEESVWRKVSPCYMDPGLWLTSKEVVISHSLEDELVGQDQAEAMLNCLRSTKTWQGQARFVTVEGAHDSIWSEGHAMAQLIESALAGIHIFA